MENQKKVLLNNKTTQNAEKAKTKVNDIHSYSMECDGCWWEAVAGKGSSSLNTTMEGVWGADTFKSEIILPMETETTVETIWEMKTFRS